MVLLNREICATGGPFYYSDNIISFYYIIIHSVFEIHILSLGLMCAFDYNRLIRLGFGFRYDSNSLGFEVMSRSTCGRPKL